MLFIDFENFDISKYSYYKKRYNDEKEKVTKQGNDATQVRFDNPKLDFNKLPQEIIKLLNQPHVLVKTMLFAPKPDDFLMKDERRKSVYNWINGMRNQDFFTVIPNYSRISGIAYENGYVRENSSKTDTLQSFPPKKGALLPWGSDNF